jgi:hypothetical protein
MSLAVLSVLLFVEVFTEARIASLQCLGSFATALDLVNCNLQLTGFKMPAHHG